MNEIFRKTDATFKNVSHNIRIDTINNRISIGFLLGRYLENECIQ